ncbi:GPR1/FUN34/yaaH family-domain-containing protein [Astrocystis sublimbata]|nr:GPR1/FUN34/yaaH family-domain-containing protein [Astrocystis sublimbata]
MSQEDVKGHRNISEHHEERLHHAPTAGAMSLSPEHFEAAYLAPKKHVEGRLRQTFGNPTPVALAGFLLATTPLAMVLQGWQGAGGFVGNANVGSYIFLAGLLLTLGGIGEWILGNTFPSTVFFTFGGFWLTVGVTIVPGTGAYGLYSKTDNPAGGLENPQFYATISFFLIAMTLVCLVFTIAAIRTDVCLFTLLLLLVVTFGVLAGSFFAASQGAMEKSEKLQHVGAGVLLAVAFIGWYMFLGQVLESVDFPISLPVGDLSTVVPARRKE